MAEGARLESVYTGNRIVGSNPTLSAMLRPCDRAEWRLCGEVKARLSRLGLLCGFLMPFCIHCGGQRTQPAQKCDDLPYAVIGGCLITVPLAVPS